MGQLFSDDYKRKLFQLWYQKGKPSVPVLCNNIPDDWGGIPHVKTLSKWIHDDFVPMADRLDEEVEIQLRNRLVSEKLEMLARHAQLGMEMQNLAVEYLEKHKEDITSAAAVRLLVEGWRIERESRGIPTALEKLSKMSDDELLDEVKQLLSNSSIEVEPNE